MGWLKNLMGQKQAGTFDPSTLKVDMHSHLIPDIDDGSDSLEDSILMILALKEMGYEKIITTPHIKLGSFDNTTEIIREGEALVKAELQKRGIDIPFEAAAEYFFDFSFMERIEKGDIMTFSNNHMLVEFAFGQPPVGEKEMFFALQMKGYKPILAHFERYAYFHGSTSRAQELRDKGIKIQVNIGSFYGQYGPQIQRQAELMLKNGVIDLLATDCHRLEQLELYKGNLGHKNMVKLNDLAHRNLEFL